MSKPAPRMMRTVPNRSTESTDEEDTSTCPFHEGMRHGLLACPKFQSMNSQEKFDHLFGSGRCFRCTGRHLARDCSNEGKCDKCSRPHNTLLHEISDYRPPSRVSNQLAPPPERERRNYAGDSVGRGISGDTNSEPVSDTTPNRSRETVA